MAVIRATLGDFPLLVTEDVGWTFTPGTQPFQRVFTIPRAMLPLIGESIGVYPMTLKIESDTLTEPMTVEKLWILRTSPAQHPDQVGIVVSDIRWMWRYCWVIRRYNIKRLTGNKRQLDDTIFKLFQQTTDDIEYAAYSLKPPAFKEAWTASDVIKDVMSLVAGSFDDSGVDYANAVEVEGLELDDDGPSALNRIFTLVPGVTCKVNEKGDVILYQATDGGEFDQVNNMGPLTVGSMLYERVSMRAERPRRIHVHFTREHELRFDFRDPQVTGENDRYMINVLPLPESITLNGQSLAAGTWVEITDDLLSAWYANRAPITPSGKAAPQLTLAVLRQIWNSAGYNVYMEAASDSDQIWARRLKTLRDHYRTVFKINRRWMERLLAILPKRVALLDSVNDAWAPASIYSDYALVPSYRRLAVKDGDPTQFAFNITGWAEDLEQDGILAQAKLQILDDQLGIVYAQYANDAMGMSMGVMPSQVEGYDPSTGVPTGMPSADIAGLLKVLTQSRLKDVHSLAVVLTGIPGSPNDIRQTYDRVVELDEAKSVLPFNVAQMLPDAIGPEMHIHVGLGIQTARYAWSDKTDQAKAIHDSIIDGSAVPPQELCVNQTILDDIAKALAAATYSDMVDHVEGEATSILNPSITLDGRMGSLQHILRSDGAAMTRLSLPPTTVPISFWHLLPESARRIIKRQLPR